MGIMANIDSKPPAAQRHTTAPTILTVNGHFAPVSSEVPSKEQYAHGIQVIDEEKAFKWVLE